MTLSVTGLVTCHAAFRRLLKDVLHQAEASARGRGAEQDPRAPHGRLAQQEGSPAPHAGSARRTPGASAPTSRVRR